MMRRLPLLAVGAILAIPLLRADDPRVGDVVSPVPPAEKVERARAANGFGFPPSPAVNVEPDPVGFRRDRLFSVPAPGVHPRILFGPEDVLRIRKELESNPAGRATIKALQSQLKKGIDDPKTWEGQCFAALVAGNLEAFRTAFKESPLDYDPPGSGFKLNMPGRSPATRWGVRNPLLAGIEAKAFLALIEDDPAAGKQVAAALATYAKFISPKVDAANATWRAPFHWASTRELVPNEIAYAYDWAWPWMNSSQRSDLHDLIVKATAGKYTLGMDLPPHWRNWNHLGLTNSYVACLFAIEGEPGDDPVARERMFEVYRDYLSYAIDGLGFGSEGIGYQTGGIAHISAPMIAYANRGLNLLTHPHWRRHSESWLVQAMQPFGGAWQSSSDLANFPPNLGMVAVQSYFFPESPGIDFVYRNHPKVIKGEWESIAIDANEAQWITTCVPDKNDSRDAAQRAAAKLVGGGLTFFDAGRGSLYTRTGWGKDDLVLHVDCDVDTTFANHDHPDRGQFTLSALGRAWACDGYRDTESKFHNVVTIDGRGQAYFTPPGSWVEMTDDATETTAVSDAKYPWDWQWMKSSFTESDASLRRRGMDVFIEPAHLLQSRVPLKLWEADPLPVVRAYNEGFADHAHGDPRMWDDEDGWVIRAPWYPVQKAFRTVRLARGAHPYVLVIDDIRKDDAEHLYEWRMNMPPDIVTVSIQGNDILLGDSGLKREPVELLYGFQGKTGFIPAKGDRLLLVRTLEIGEPSQPTLQPIPSVSTIEYKKTDDSHQFTGRSMGMGTQVVIGSRSVEPEFVILLFPHRHGDELPVTKWNDDRSQLTISWSDQTDVYDVTKAPVGRRIFKKQALDQKVGP